MDTLIHADIFFFVTTIAVIMIATAFFIILVYIILILRKIDNVLQALKNEAHAIVDDVRALRQSVKEEGVRARDIFDFALGFIKRRTRKVRSKLKNNSETK